MLLRISGGRTPNRGLCSWKLEGGIARLYAILKTSTVIDQLPKTPKSKRLKVERLRVAIVMTFRRIGCPDRLRLPIAKTAAYLGLCDTQVRQAPCIHVLVVDKGLISKQVETSRFWPGDISLVPLPDVLLVSVRTSPTICVTGTTSLARVPSGNLKVGTLERTAFRTYHGSELL